MKRVLFLLICAGVLILNLTGCSHKVSAKGVPDSPVNSLDEENQDIADSDNDMNDSGSTTAYIVVTDAQGQIVTQADGTPVTSIAYGTLPTKTVNVTDASGQTVTQADGTPVTAVITPPTVTTKIAQVTDAQGNGVTNGQGEAVTTCEVSPVATTTRNSSTDTGDNSDQPQPEPEPQPQTQSQSTTETNAPSPAPAPVVHTATTATTAVPKPVPTTPPTVKDAWHNPYDLDAIYADCKAEVERQGITWNESLRPNNSSWIGTTSTVLYSYHPDKYSLKN